MAILSKRQIKAEMARDLIMKSGNQTFGVTFIKKTDGSIRNMQARLHVSKGVKGTGNGNRKAEDKAHNVLTVYDMNKVEDGKPTKGAFRRISLDQVLRIKVRGIELNFAE